MRDVRDNCAVDCDMSFRNMPGEAMNNVAVTLADLGRHEDALVLKEETLKFRQRVLPEDHPEIGAGCSWKWHACARM